MVKRLARRIWLPQLVVLIVTVIVFGVFVRLSPSSSASSSKPLPSADKPYTIVVLPDTQYYAAHYPEIFYNQTAWIAANKQARNIVYVTHVGDVVDDPSSEEQWRVASAAMAKLDGVVPYGIAPGNHDLLLDGSAPLYAKYFPTSRLQSDGDWGGSFLTDPKYAGSAAHDKNTYRLFSAGRNRYIAFNLEFCPPDKVLQWTSEVLYKYPGRRAIITTHSFLDKYGDRSEPNGCWVTNHAGMNAGAQIWDKLVVATSHPNLWMFIGGHNNVSETGAARRNDLVRGHNIWQLLDNYQQFSQGGSGYLRLMTVTPTEHKIRVQTYSPFLDQYLTDPTNQFEIDL
jgi:hypothetical protein